MKKYRLEEFQLSQSYLFFWDKLEKANYFLESIMDTLERDFEDRLVQELLKSPVGKHHNIRLQSAGLLLTWRHRRWRPVGHGRKPCFEIWIGTPVSHALQLVEFNPH